MSGPTVEPVYWTDDDPERLASDVADLAEFAPDLTFHDPGPTLGGYWLGRLPRWPFERPEPPGLDVLVPEGLLCMVECSPVHPVLPPSVFPADPEPEPIEHSMHKWHVAPQGSLCLMQTFGAWDPRERVSQLLMKACGWRVEYALMKAGAVETMSLRGIVDDDSFDGLVTATAAAQTEQRAASKPAESDGAGDE